MRRPLTILALTLAASTPLFPRVAHAAAPPSLTIPGASGQQALALRVEGAALRARVCGSGACEPDGGAALGLPEDVRPLVGNAALKRVELRSGRSVARLDVPGKDGAGTWVMLVAAPASGKGAEPVVIYAGWTAVAKGEAGEERSAIVLEEPIAGKSGAVRLLVGERRGDVTVCGRPALVAAKEVDPLTFELTRGASAESLSREERDKAPKITASRVVAAASKTSGPKLLRAMVASSAVDKKMGTLTDGDADTVWSENKTGEGRGEFVVMSSASEVAINTIEIAVKPSAPDDGGAAPRSFYLATSDRVIAVAMPEDAWRQAPGTRYAIALPAPLHTSCLAVVLGDAYANAKNTRVTIAEIEAKTPFDGMSVEALAGALAGGGERPKGAGAMLARAGKEGVAAAISVYDKLDDTGRELARDVIDGAPCGDQAPFYTGRLIAAMDAKGDDPDRDHARDRLRRCGRLAAPPLAAIIAKGFPAGGPADARAIKAALLAANEIVLAAPAEAIAAITAAIDKADDGMRRELRAALSVAARNPRALPALREQMTPERFGALSEVAAIDLMRAAGPSLGKVEGAAQAFAAISAKYGSTRARYLLQAPAGELAKAGDAQAEAYLRASLTQDAAWYVRARAVVAAARVPSLAAAIVAAIDDAEVRVREAAIAGSFASLSEGDKPPQGLAAALGKRLATDDWTFVRAAAARALGVMPPDAAIDQALVAALSDASHDVRGKIIEALGARRATAHAELIRARQDDEEEWLDVRVRAVFALAAMCDSKSLDAWTKLALRAKSPNDERERRLGAASIVALGAVHPADLERRLAPLVDKDSPSGAKELARSAIASKGRCEP